MKLPAHSRHQLSAFLQDFALSSSFVLVPFHIYDQIGGGAGMSGTVAAVQSLCYAAACLLVSRIAHRFSHPIRVAVFGCLGFGLITPLVAFTRTGVLAGLISIAGLICLALYWPAMQSWMGSEPSAHLRAKRMAQYTIAWSLGLATGPLLAGWLYDYAGYGWAFGSIGVVTMSAAFFAFTLPASLQAHQHKSEDVVLAVDIVASQRHLYPAWVANFVSWGIMGAMRGVFPKRIHELVDDSAIHALWSGGPISIASAPAATLYAVLLLGLYGARALTSYSMGRWPGWHYRFGLILTSQAVAAFALLGIGLSNSFAVILLCGLAIGFNGGVTYFASLYYSVADPAHRHGRAAIHESLVGIGGFCAAITAGALAERFGVGTPFVWAPGLIVFAVIVQLTLLRAHRQMIEASTTNNGGN